MSEVELREVTKLFDSVAALDRVSLHVQNGEFLTVLGPTGAGKTTMLNVIGGFEQPSSGKILIAGRDVTRVGANKRNVGMLFQQYALFPHLNVFENVAFPLRIRRVPSSEIETRVRRALGMVSLEGYERRRIHQLSGGQQQRVGLARAFVFDPAILLLDEPLSALDRKLRTEMELELRALQQRLGTTVINVTHDQEEALTLSDRIVIIRDGRVQQGGTPSDLYLRPASRFVADFFGIANLFEGVVRQDGGQAFLELTDGTRLAVGRADARDGDEAVCMLRPEQLRLEAPTRGDGFAARVTRSLYLGEKIRYDLETSFGATLTVTDLHQGQRRAEGEAVRVTFSPDNVWMIPGETRSTAGDALGVAS